MENLYIDLNDKQDHSKGAKLALKIAGALFIILSFIDLYRKYIDHRDVFFPIFYLILGISYLMQGFGFTFHKAKQFIDINQETINFKLSVFAKGATIHWNKISKIEINTTAILFTTTDGILTKFGLSWVSYKNVNKIKLLVRHIAKLKNIKLIG